MRISKRRVRSVENYLQSINAGSQFYIVLVNPEQFSESLIEIGFNENLTEGFQILPESIGPVSKFNVYGGFERLRDEPREVCSREFEFKDWHGNSHTSYFNYTRYKRRIITPPSEELTVRKTPENNFLITSRILTFNENSLNKIKHLINLFLEYFGECHILKDDLTPVINVPIERLNWDVFPEGEFPWEVLEPRVRTIVSNINQRRRSIVSGYIEHISSKNPNFVAVGRAGFKGYMVFGFKNKSFFILESTYTGNATYVLSDNWSEISKLSKGQILNQNLHNNRIIHNQGWINEVDNLFD